MTGLATPGGSGPVGLPGGHLASVAGDSFPGAHQAGSSVLPRGARACGHLLVTADSRMPEPSAELSQRGSGWPLLTPSLFSAEFSKCNHGAHSREAALCVSWCVQRWPITRSMAELNQEKRTEVGKTMSDFHVDVRSACPVCCRLNNSSSARAGSRPRTVGGS